MRVLGGRSDRPGGLNPVDRLVAVVVVAKALRDQSLDRWPLQLCADRARGIVDALERRMLLVGSDDAEDGGGGDPEPPGDHTHR